MREVTLRSVLLVDDDEASNFISKIFISKLQMGIDTHAVLNGKQALDFLDELVLNGKSGFGPCLLLLDINMPIMNGWEFLDAYNERYPQAIKDHIVIVMITVSQDQKDFILASNSPLIKEYVQKPLSDLKMMGLIEKYFLSPEQEDEEDEDDY